VVQVYCVSQPDGARDDVVHEVDATVHQQAQPVPHGFLAKSILVWGTIDAQNVVPDIHSVKIH